MNMTDYETARRTFRLHVPEDYEFTRDVVEHWAAQHPGKLALVALDQRGEGRREITFGDLARASRRVANALEGLGVTAGERAFVMLPRIPEWYELLLGMFRFGVVPMPATTLCTRARHRAAHRARAGHARGRRRRGRRQAGHRPRPVPVAAPRDRRGRRRSRPEASATTSSLARASDAEPTGRATRADDPLLLYFTSGTVAAPKMVLHTQASMGAGHEITARFWQDLTPADLHWTFSDTGWAKAAWGKLFGQWRMGASVFLWDQRGKLDPELCLRRARALGRHHVLRAADAVPGARPARPRRLRPRRAAPLASRPASRSTPRSSGPGARPPGSTIYDGYGQTETVNLVANFPCLEVRPGSMGKPTPGYDVDVVSDDGVRLGPGEEGHIALATEPERPVGLFPGYWRDDEANAEVFRDGWYFTGDRAVQGRGRLLLVRRPRRRRHHLGRVPHRPVRGRVRARRASGGRRVGGRRQARCRAHEHRQGVRRPRARARGLGRPGARAAGARQDGHRAVQVPARDRVRRRAAQDDQRQDPPQRAARALVTQLPPFAIERYFAVHEFAVPYLLCASDVEPVSMRELLAYADDETRELWDGLVLGYTETLGSPQLRAGDRRPLRDAGGRRRDRRRGRERGALHPVLGARAAGRSRDRPVAGVPVALRPRALAGRGRRADRVARRGRLGARRRPDRRRHAADDARRRRQPPAQPDRHAPRGGGVRRARRPRRAARRDARVRRGLPRARARPGRPAARRPRIARTAR